MEDLIKKYALQNAVRYNGKANPGNIIGKILGEKPELKAKLKDLMPKIQKAVKEVNSMPIEQQRSELESLAPELLEKKEKEERDIFAFLKLEEPVNTAFPPGPEKYPHIGHAKACLLNYMLAKKYDGKFILRFEDTNPALVQEKFYKIMLENFEWLGVKPDKVVYASDYMKDFYKYAEKLITENKAYICTCSSEKVKESRMKKIPCSCRDKTPEQNLKEWKTLPETEPGKAIVRLKIDLSHKNTTMRDPTIFRIIDQSHPRQKDRYKVWPNYDFQNSIMDSLNDVTIRLRSKEFELRSELQRWIQKNLNIKQTSTYEFARFNMKGVLSSGRVIREKVEKNELIGWDDPELTTIVALRRRGFLPEAIKNFVISTGITKSESTMTWDDLILQNKRLLDDTAKRFSAIFDPVELTIEDVPYMKVELHLNPNEKKGGRKFYVTDKFFLSEKDVKSMKDKELVRLMDCINIMKKENKVCFMSARFEEFRGKGRKVINWLPEKENIEIEVLMPDKKIKKGIAESTIKDLKVGEVIQFERFGFCRLDSIKKNKYYFWFTHG